MSLITKINIAPIVRAHLVTLRDARLTAETLLANDVYLFYGVPCLFGLLSLVVIPTEALINVLVTSLSVFAALLFNLLMLVLSVIEKRKGNKVFFQLQRETYANISYAILVALITVALLLIPYFYAFTSAPTDPPTTGQRVFWGAIYFLLVNFGLTMAMILRRMHAILVKLIDIDD